MWYPIAAGPPPDLYVPYVVTAAERLSNRGYSLSVVGRLRSGATVEQARADVVRISSSPVVVLPLHDQVVGSAKTWLVLVLAAVGFVLLVACVNVASLLLARATIRAREFATRAALGASRGRLAASLLLEGLILAFASAAASIVASLWGVEMIKAGLPPGLTRVSAIAVDGRVLAVSIAAAALCAVVFATAPVWLALRSDLVGLMKGGGGPVIGGRRRDRALGATPSRVMRSVLQGALQRVGLGVGIGLIGTWTLSNTLSAFVFGIPPTEPLVYLGVGGFLAVVGALAALAPALRAARLDPLVALRHE